MKQLRILHLSDVHFGRHHRCNPEDPTNARAGYPTLYELISKDLSEGPFDHAAWRPGNKGSNPMLVMMSGDLTETAGADEFKSVYQFLTRFNGASLLDSELTLKNIFMVPGNHDVDYTKDEPEERLTHYTNFYSKLYKGTRGSILPEDAESLSQIHVDVEQGFVVAEINSAFYVQKDTVDGQRGNVDMRVIKNLREALAKIPESQMNAMIRVAIIHHHPILVPALVEAGRGYDAVANSHHLLKLLREFGFQLVLHGHKHYPHTFSYDTDSPWSKVTPSSMLVVSGGSTSSRELPSGTRRCNTYNLISIKWHPEAEQARVRIITRGLVTEDGEGELTPDQWRWETFRDADRRLTPSHLIPAPSTKSTLLENLNTVSEKLRKQVYAESRLNMIVSEVLPSLMPGQAYEVRAWIVPHVDKHGEPKFGWEPPERVVWSAGPNFKRKAINRQDDSHFCCSYNYWGSMIVQAEMHFVDGHVAYGHTYARIPELTKWSVE